MLTPWCGLPVSTSYSVFPPLAVGHRPDSVIRRNGTVSYYTFNAAGQLTYLKHDLSGDSIDVFNYYYDPVGVRDSLVNLTGLHSFVYDSLYQLIGVTHADSATNPNEWYYYDAVGNRDSSHLSSSYTVDSADRLTEDDSCYYGYDDAGRMIYRKHKVSGYGYNDAGRMINGKYRLSGDSTAFEYTVDGQLIKAHNDDIELQFAYDGIGNRIRKIIIENSDTTVVKYSYDGADLLFEKDEGDTLRIRYLYGPGIDHILESVDSVGAKQHFADALGSVSKITDNTGSILKKFTYDSFGNIVADSGSVIADDVTYTGREHESALGIYYYRARYYDPLTGRFMAKDPLGFATGDVNLYRYVGNNPLNFRDPLGLYSGESYVETGILFYLWVTGQGPSHLYFGPNSNQVRDIKDATMVYVSRIMFYLQNPDLSDPCFIGPIEIEPYERDIEFGFVGLLSAGLDPTEQFIGSYNISITPNYNGTITFTITNVTSMTSFTRYIFGNRFPSWERYWFPYFGNMTQTYTWTEELRK